MNNVRGFVRAQWPVGSVVRGRPKGQGNKRGPGRPRKTARRGPGRPRKAMSATDALQGLVAGMKATERENAQLRGTLERVAELIRRAL